MRTTPKATLLLAGAVLLGLGSLPTASADHYSGGTGQEGCGVLNAPQANQDQNYYYDDLQAESSAAVTWNRVNNINPTQMNTALSSTYTSATDVWVGDRYYDDYCGVDWYRGPSDPDGNGAVGMGNCFREVAGSGKRCDQHDLRLNNWFTDNTTTSNIRGLACHEGGHTLGLGHRPATANGSCMPQGYPKPANAYDPHDRNGINQNS